MQICAQWMVLRISGLVGLTQMFLCWCVCGVVVVVVVVVVVRCCGVLWVFWRCLMWSVIWDEVVGLMCWVMCIV